MVTDDDFLDDFDDDIDDDDETIDQEADIESLELAEIKSKEQARKNLLARRRIDELMENKRLKALFDDEEDW